MDTKSNILASKNYFEMRSTDEDQWPADRDHALFATWFSVEVHSMVLDLEEGPVTKE